MRHSVLPLLLVVLALTASLAPWMLDRAEEIAFDASMDVFLAADERTRGSIDKLESLMSDQKVVMVVLSLPDLFSDAGARLVHEAGRALEGLDGVSRVLDLTRAKRPVRSETFTFDVRKLITFEPFLPLESLSAEEWQQRAELVTSYPWSRDLLVSADGRHTMLVAEIARPLADHAERVALRDDVRATLAPFRDRVDSIHVGSFPFIEAEVQEGIQADVRRFLTVLPLLLLVILLVTFRSVTILVCVLLFEALGMGLLPVLFEWDGSPINLYTALLFPLVAGLQLTFLTHLFSTLQFHLRRGHDLAHALPAALSHVTRPSAIALVTTVLGLLSLLTCDVGLVRDVGRLGAIAVVMVFGVTFAPTWALAAVLRARHAPDALQPPRDDGSRRWAVRLAPLVDVLVGRRRLVLGLWAVAVLAALPAWSLVRTDLRAIEFLEPESEARASLEFVDTHIGGMNVYELVLDTGRPGGIDELPTLRFLEQVREHAEGLPGVTNVYTYSQIFTLVNGIIQGDGAELALPESQTAIDLIGGVMSTQDFLFQESIADPTGRQTTLFVRTRDMPAEVYLRVLESLMELAEDELPEGMRLDAKAGIHTVLDSDRRIVSSQVRSLALAVLAVWLTLAVLWRDPRLALLAVLANLPALAAVLALLGYAALPLNSVTVMVAAIVLGIAVDDSIHLLSFWREERGRHDDPRDAVREVLAHKLKPMACTTAVLLAGLGLFLGASFPPVADFGLASVTALAVALLSVLLLLPALLTDGRAAAREG